MPAWSERRSSRFELLLVEPQVEARGREADARAQILAVPALLHPVAVVDRRATSAGERLAREAALGAQHRPLGAVEDVALGDTHLPGEDELFLDDVLHGLDRDRVEGKRPGADAYAVGEAGRRLGIEGEREERLADRHLDLGRAPRDDVARAADGDAERPPRLVRRATCERRITSAFATSTAPCSISAASTKAERSASVTRPESPSSRSRASTARPTSATRAGRGRVLPTRGGQGAERIGDPAAELGEVERTHVSERSRSPRCARRRRRGRRRQRTGRCGELAGGKQRGALDLQVVEDLVEVDDHGGVLSLGGGLELVVGDEREG